VIKIIPAGANETILPESIEIVRERLNKSMVNRKFIEGYYSNDIFHVTQCPRYFNQIFPPVGTIYLKELDAKSTAVHIEISPSAIKALLLLSILIFGMGLSLVALVTGRLSIPASLAVFFAAIFLYKILYFFETKFIDILEKRIQRALQFEEEKDRDKHFVPAE
jgi:hypothetical protein